MASRFQNCGPQEALAKLNKLSSFEISSSDLITVMKICNDANQAGNAKAVFSRFQQLGLQPDGEAILQLIRSLRPSGDFVAAMAGLDAMESAAPAGKSPGKGVFSEALKVLANHQVTPRKSAWRAPRSC
jgi:hypothetical protein